MKLLLILFFFFNLQTCKDNFDAAYLHIELKDIQNKTIQLGDFKGKILILDFWASWCLPCKKAVVIIESIRKKTDPKNIIVLGVNTDSSLELPEIISTAKDFGITYNSILDPELKLVKELNVEGQPAIFIFDKTGKIQFTQYGIISSDLPAILKKIKDLENE